MQLSPQRGYGQRQGRKSYHSLRLGDGGGSLHPVRVGKEVSMLLKKNGGLLGEGSQRLLSQDFFPFQLPQLGEDPAQQLRDGSPWTPVATGQH